MAYTQTIVLHLTVEDDSPNPINWPWDAELDMSLQRVDGNEFYLIDYTLEA